MLATHAVGIDLGTTYSCIAYLNEHGEPVSIPNHEGELSTPSAVLFDGQEIIVGTEALRNAILLPKRVVQNSKRFMGDPRKSWEIDGRKYTPTDIATFILKRLLADAGKKLGKIERAVVTVPAQFSDAQRQATVQAGIQAGLKQVDIINEPVAAALCYVLGTEGLWFTELANAQRILVYDLGGGTFDLSLVKYQKDEVSVIASTGDLHLGGIDWNQALIDAVSVDFKKEFGADPREDLESLQYLAWESEQTKRSLSVRPRASLSCQHAGKRKTFQIEQEQFARLTEPLVKRTEQITLQLLKDNRLGWAHVDVVLITGGSSRMPMIRNMLKKLSGRTLNTSLSPDQSIAHGATYYAGMLISRSEFVKSILTAETSARLSKVRQQSVTARGLGILIRDPETDLRVPCYLIPANTPLPASITQSFGTIMPNQKRVHLHVIESGARADLPHVELGTCLIDALPPELPRDSEIQVTISYDESARVHVSAIDVTSGKAATTEILREDNIVRSKQPENTAAEVNFRPAAAKTSPQAKAAPALPAAPQRSQPAPKPVAAAAPMPKPKPVPPAAAGPRPVARNPDDSVDFDVPVPLCNTCGERLNSRGMCTRCAAKKVPTAPDGNQPARPRPVPRPVPAAVPTLKRDSAKLVNLEDSEILELPIKSKTAASQPPVKKIPSIKPVPRSGPREPG